MAATRLPTQEHHYLHPLLNDRQWEAVIPRNDDVIVTSAFKAGTTWMQTIIANLIFQDQPWPAPVMNLSPWVDRYRNEEQMRAMTSMLAAQSHRRFLKSHLPLTAIKFFPQAKYVFVARDPRDIFMSLWNHHNNYSDDRQALHREIAREINQAWPDIPQDINEFFELWITTPWFEWESEGFPYWSVFYNFRTWWSFRKLPNIIFVHYNDLLLFPEAQIKRVADFLDIAVARDYWPTLLDNISLESMRRDGPAIMGDAESSFKGGAATFLNKGTNGRWKGVLSEANLTRYEQVATRNLDRSARHWLEHGGEFD